MEQGRAMSSHTLLMSLGVCSKPHAYTACELLTTLLSLRSPIVADDVEQGSAISVSSMALQYLLFKHLPNSPNNILPGLLLARGVVVVSLQTGHVNV